MIKSAAITDGAPLQVDFGNDEVKGQTVPGRVFPHWLKRTKHTAMMEDMETWIWDNKKWLLFMQQWII